MTGALLLLITLAQAPADTVVQLRRGDRVVMENLAGELSVVGWNQDRMDVRGVDGPSGLSVRRSGSEVRISGIDGRRRRRGGEASIRLPAWVDVEIGGPSLEVTVRDMDGSLRVNNVSGDVTIANIGGALEVRSIDGEIDIDGARAGVRASSQSDDVTIRRSSGAIDAHSGSGDIVLDDIRSQTVRAETQDGDITFSGEISDGGSYGFYVHDGDALIEVPRSVNARVSVSTFDGEFESEFPVVVERFTAGRQFAFQLGNGSASLEIEVFDGEIRLMQRR
jgi:hypothetical protein